MFMGYINFFSYVTRVSMFSWVTSSVNGRQFSIINNNDLD